MTSELPIDHAEREAAASSTARRVLVEAGAGTGKTHLLVDRVCRLVERGTALDRIVAITFTEKAAGELRARIRDEVAVRAEMGRSGMEAARLAVDRAPISTIHAFAATILRRYAIDAGVDPSFEILEESEAEEVLGRAWDAWLPAALARGAPAWLDVVSAVGPIEIAPAARALATSGDVVLPPRSGLTPTAALGDLCARVAALQAFARGVPASDRLRAEIERFARALAGASENPGGLLDLGVRKERGTKGAWGGRIEGARSRWAEICAVLEDARSNVGGDLAQGLAAFLLDFRARARADLVARGALTFDELLVVTRDLLLARPEVSRRIAARHPHVCVDEFQDTDPVQAEILDLLEAAGSSLLLVGDPKQSVYGFRGADVELFARARDRAVERWPIRQSFRASGRVVAAVNAIFRKVLGPGGQPWEIPHADLAPRRADGEGPAAVVVLRPPAGTKRSPSEAREAEAPAVVRLLERMVREGWPVGDDARRVGWGDVAILLRKMTDAADVYARALEEAGIDFLVVGGKRFFLQTEVQAIVAALAAIDDPARAVAVVGALRSPLFGVSDAALLEARAALDPRSPGGGAVGEALATLGQLHQDRGSMPPHRLVERLVDETRLHAVLAVKPDGARRIGNVAKLVEAARAMGPPGTTSLRAFVRWCEEQTHRLEFGEPEAPVADESEPVLRILSIHASKGLEFPVVVLGEPAGDLGHHALHRLESGGITQVSFGADLRTAGWDAAKERRGAREQAEERRLLYVALTRARDRIVLPLFGDRKRYAERIADALPGALTAAPGDDVDVGGLQAMVVEDDGRERGEPASRIDVRAVVATRVESDAIEREAQAARARLAEARGPSRVAPSSLGAGEAADDDYVHDADDELPWAVRASMDVARRIGIAVHTALEEAPLGDADAAVGIATVEARRLDLGSPEQQRCADLAARGMRSQMVQRAMRAKRVWREVPFTLLREGALMEGRIDLLFEEEDGLVVVDYKTGSADEAEYARQLAAYADAVESITGKRPKESRALRLGLQPG